jgi:hypothetical protein
VSKPRNGVLFPLFVFTVALFVLTACGGGGEEALGGIPEPPPDAQVLADEQLPFTRAQMAAQAKTSMGVSQVEYDVYLLPSDRPYARLLSYYEGFLDDGWLAMDTDAVQQARSQGLEANIWRDEKSKHFFSIQYQNSPDLGGNVLIVMYARQ